MNYYELSLQKKKEIEDGLLELMRSTPFSQIFVTDLTRHLDVSRKCFYHYFPNREACLESLLDRIIQEAALFVTVSTSQEHSTTYSLDACTKNLEYWKSQREFLCIIHNNHLEHIFLQRYCSYILQEGKTLHHLMDTDDIKFDEDILLFYITGKFALLMQWCQNDFQPPAQEMARKFERLLYRPLIQHSEM